MKSKKYYYGFDVTMYIIGDHLWIANVIPNAQHVVKQFNYNRRMWIRTTYVADEIQNLFNVSIHILK